MNPTTLMHWLKADWTHMLVALGAVLMAYSIAWGSYKAAFFKITGHALPRNWFTLSMDIGVELSNNLLGFVNKVLLSRGATPLFPAPTPPLVSPPTPEAPPAPQGPTP